MGTPHPGTADNPAATRAPAPGCRAGRRPERRRLGRCAGRLSHRISIPTLRVATRLRSFAAEPVKESAIRSTVWAEPGVAWGPPGDGAEEERWGLGFWVVCGFLFFFVLKCRREGEIPARRVGKLSSQISPRGDAEPVAPQIS